MKNRLDHNAVLLLITMGFLFLPLVQEITRLIPFIPLKGAVVDVKRENWSIQSWFSGTFQENQEQYVQANFDARKFLIRINNQFNYSFFGKASSPNYFIGRDNYLFSEEVVLNHLGVGALEEDSVKEELRKLKFVQDTLQKLNKHLVFMVAPGKASIYLDKIPNSKLKGKKANNYDLFVKHSKALNINYVDYSAYFKQLKKDSTFPLFPHQGLHWSIYSTSYVIDSLVHYIEFQKRTKLTTYNWNQTEFLEPKGTDVDVEDVFNLLFTIDSPELPYRTLAIQKRNNDSLKVLAIGDSFYRELFNNGLKEILPSTHEFWFYGRVSKAHDSNMENDLHVSQFDFKEKINDADIIIILYYEGNLGNVGYIMVDRLYRLFTNQSLLSPMDQQFNDYVKQRITVFQKDEAMMKKIKEKAELKKVNVDAMVKAEAAMSVEYDIWNGNITLKR